MKGCISDLSVSPTTVRPNSNCLYTVTGSPGSYPEYGTFAWYKSGWRLTGLDSYQENVAAGTSSFTLLILAGGPSGYGSYYSEGFTITVSSGAPICVEAPQQ